MGWSLGGPDEHGRFVGYGVPAFCDHPDCAEEIDRGLAYVCGNQEPFGGEHGCGLYFCENHRDGWGYCERCSPYVPHFNDDYPDDEDREHDEELPDVPRDWSSFEPKPEHPRWIAHLLFDKSWAQWRKENPAKVKELKRGAA